MSFAEGSQFSKVNETKFMSWLRTCRRIESNALAFTSVELDLRNYFDLFAVQVNRDAMPAVISRTTRPQPQEGTCRSLNPFYLGNLAQIFSIVAADDQLIERIPRAFLSIATERTVRDSRHIFASKATSVVHRCRGRPTLECPVEGAGFGVAK